MVSMTTIVIQVLGLKQPICFCSELVDMFATMHILKGRCTPRHLINHYCAAVWGSSAATVWALSLYTELQTICTGPVQLWRLMIALGWANWKNHLFWACGQQTHGKNPSKNPQWGRIVRGKKQMKSNTPEVTQSSSWANWWLLGPLSSSWFFFPVRRLDTPW